MNHKLRLCIRACMSYPACTETYGTVITAARLTVYCRADEQITIPQVQCLVVLLPTNQGAIWKLQGTDLCAKAYISVYPVGCVADAMDSVPICVVCIKHFGTGTEDHRPHSLPCGHSLCYRCLSKFLFAGTDRRTGLIIC